MSNPSAAAFSEEVRSGRIELGEKGIEDLIRKHENLTEQETMEIVEQGFGRETARRVSSYLSGLVKKGKVLTKVRICTVTSRDASGHYINPDWTPDKQKEYEYQAATRTLLSALDTYNTRADKVGKLDAALINPKSLLQDLGYLATSLNSSDFATQVEAATRLIEIITELKDQIKNGL